jgi:signal transduction histidine kinase
MPAPAERRRRGALPPLPVEAARAALSPPRVPPSALPGIALARRAAALNVPVWLEMPVGGGRTLLARALHAEAGRPGPLLAAEASGRALRGLPPGATVLLDVAQLAEPAVAAIEALLDDATAWPLLVSSPGATPAPPLHSRLGAVTIRVPPLAQRATEIGALAAHLLGVLSARRGAATPHLTQAALDWLACQPWPGDVAELEAVVARALIGTDAAVIDVPQLTGAPAVPEATDDGQRAQLAFLVAQLAHELRNPLAAVKTFAQVPGLADDPAMRARFASLIDDAVVRVDGLLDDTAAFARFAAPAPTPIELRPLLDGLIAEVRPALAERAIALSYTSPNGARCIADREQLTYALRAILDGVARGAPPDDGVRVDASLGDRVSIEFDDRHGSAGRLRHVALGDGGAEVLALPFVLARAVLERNGGALALQRQSDGRAVLEVRLPGATTGGG